jgi:hypothetical protein
MRAGEELQDGAALEVAADELEQEAESECGRVDPGLAFDEERRDAGAVEGAREGRGVAVAVVEEDGDVAGLRSLGHRLLHHSRDFHGFHGLAGRGEYFDGRVEGLCFPTRLPLEDVLLDASSDDPGPGDLSGRRDVDPGGVHLMPRGKGHRAGPGNGEGVVRLNASMNSTALGAGRSKPRWITPPMAWLGSAFAARL